MLARQVAGTALLWLAILATSCGGRTDDRTSGRCQDFSPCGGDIEGTWEVDNVCSTDDLVAQMNTFSSQLVPACEDVIRTASITWSGTIDYSAGIETADLESVTTFTAVYTAECMAAQIRIEEAVMLDSTPPSAEPCSRAESWPLCSREFSPARW